MGLDYETLFCIKKIAEKFWVHLAVFMQAYKLSARIVKHHIMNTYGGVEA
jgi:hypothetical protein